MIQDIFPHKLDNQWASHIDPQARHTVLVFDGRKVLVKAVTTQHTTDTRSYELPKVADCDWGKLTYLFKIDEQAYFLAEAGSQELSASSDGCPSEASCPDCTRRQSDSFEFADINQLRENYLLPKTDLYAILTGKHLETWYGNTRFCGKCGGEMQHSSTERAMICQKCGNTVYPRIMPAVIVGVRNGDRLLLTRYRRGYGHNALIAGFVEIGETLEETVAREVMEEAGIRVKNIRYYKSQPWGMASDILTGFYCDVDGDDTIHMDDGELKYADWVERADIVLQPDDASLTNEMMKMFKEGRT